MIDGVRIDSLRQIADERGAIFHMLRGDDPAFERFGEIYFSFVHPGWVKGWHLHKEMVLNYAVPVGRIHLVLFDDRERSLTRGVVQEIELGADRYFRVRVPAMVWNGFIGLGHADALVANCATLPHDPSEIVRIPPDDPRVPYSWQRFGEVKGG
jgi:dTDP-4-dehydrorhamnose 3,5-epimerase